MWALALGGRGGGAGGGGGTLFASGGGDGLVLTWDGKAMKKLVRGFYGLFPSRLIFSLWVIIISQITSGTTGAVSHEYFCTFV